MCIQKHTKPLPLLVRDSLEMQFPWRLNFGQTQCVGKGLGMVHWGTTRIAKVMCYWYCTQNHGTGVPNKTKWKITCKTPASGI